MSLIWFFDGESPYSASTKVPENGLFVFATEVEMTIRLGNTGGTANQIDRSWIMTIPGAKCFQNLYIENSNYFFQACSLVV